MSRLLPLIYLKQIGGGKMATDIDSLQIKIQGTAQGANKSINQLIKNLDNLLVSIR